MGHLGAPKFSHKNSETAFILQNVLKEVRIMNSSFFIMVLANFVFVFGLFDRVNIEMGKKM